ncbi:type VI secretion system baseplate subunit TssF [Edwardsiella ictaluri]|uniref:type VI secretion system baseplate subunit TssF n=1 Tax=Edwardsiella ictaluri TaxID=67780 RepID=UPI0039F6F703
MAELLPYYNRELAFLRQLGREFASQYPKVAGRLLLEEGVSEDPHVERLIEAVAFLCARVHHKIDEQFPEITNALLGILYPHYLRPIPSISLVQFSVDPAQTNLSGPLRLPRHTSLLSRQVDGMACRFRTTYPVEIWPVSVIHACFSPARQTSLSVQQQGSAGLICIQLQAHPGHHLNTLGMDRLRFFLQGEPAVVHTLYELLFNNVTKVVLRSGAEEWTLPASIISPVGFDEDENLFDYDARSSQAYRLLHEYFVFPDKFLFFDMTGLLQATPLPEACQEIDLLIHLSEFEREGRLTKLTDTIDASTFRLGCSPVVNLFRQRAEPLQITHRKTEYQIIPDIRRPWGMEVYSVDAVSKQVKNDGQEKTKLYRPLFGLHHANDSEPQRVFWMENRRGGIRGDDPGKDVYLSLVDLDFDPNQSSSETLSIDVTCTNREFPSLLPFGGDQGDFEVDGGSLVTRIHCLRKPTSTLRPAHGRAAMWRLISHLNLNLLSITGENEEATEAFRELLGLYNFNDSPALRQQIAGIVSINSQPATARLCSRNQAAVVRGIEITLVLDESQFEGAGVYLFSAVVERFVSQYSAINSFTRLHVRTQQREQALKRWPPRAGKAVLS